MVKISFWNKIVIFFSYFVFALKFFVLNCRLCTATTYSHVNGKLMSKTPLWWDNQIDNFLAENFESKLNLI